MDKKLLENHLTENIKNLFPPYGPLAEACTYGVLPAGKMFRPLLAFSLLKDLGNPQEVASIFSPHSNHALFACALELHHAYTLVHDDLPAMDNDDYRRGRPSVHKKYGEWAAILVGDALLNASYQLIGKINSPALSFLMKLIPWATGAKGLVLGQFFDLSEKMNQDFHYLKSTHLLKTARLIQVALTGSYALLKNPQFKIGQELFRLGESIGMIFQYLDDLSELKTFALSTHEAAINPWPLQEEKLARELEYHLKRALKILTGLQLKQTQKTLGLYLSQAHENIKANRKLILKHIKGTSLDELLSSIKLICQI